MAMVSMDFKLHLPFIILYSSNNLYKTMTPLEQFNEEVMREFQDEFKQMFEDLSEDKELYFKHVFNNFITQKLTEQKELILKMVRERAPKIKIIGEGTYCQACGQHKAAGECDCIGFNKGVQEFLNNLDTI